MVRKTEGTQMGRVQSLQNNLSAVEFEFKRKFIAVFIVWSLKAPVCPAAEDAYVDCGIPVLVCTWSAEDGLKYNTGKRLCYLLMLQDYVQCDPNSN